MLNYKTRRYDFDLKCHNTCRVGPVSVGDKTWRFVPASLAGSVLLSLLLATMQWTVVLCDTLWSHRFCLGPTWMTMNGTHWTYQTMNWTYLTTNWTHWTYSTVNWSHWNWIKVNPSSWMFWWFGFGPSIRKVTHTH